MYVSFVTCRTALHDQPSHDYMKQDVHNDKSISWIYPQPRRQSAPAVPIDEYRRLVEKHLIDSLGLVPEHERSWEAILRTLTECSALEPVANSMVTESSTIEIPHKPGVAGDSTKVSHYLIHFAKGLHHESNSD